MIFIYFGKPRSGKTTMLANYVRRNDRNKKLNELLHYDLFHVYDKIYSTDYIRGTIKISPYDIGAFKPEPNSLFLVPEAGVWFNNRMSRYVPKHCTDFFAVHGHYEVDIVCDSQAVDVDKKLRDRCQLCYIVNRFGPFSRSIAVRKFIGVDNNTHDLVEGYSLPGLFTKIIDFFMGHYRILYRPFVYDFFDSYSDQIDWMHKDDSYLVPYEDNGERHTFFKKMLPLLQLIALIIGWIAAMIFVLGLVF